MQVLESVATKRNWALALEAPTRSWAPALDSRAFSVARVFSMRPYVGIRKESGEHVEDANGGNSGSLSRAHIVDICSPSKAPAMVAHMDKIGAILSGLLVG